MADAIAIVGVKGIMSKLKFKIYFSGCIGHSHACKMPSTVALEDIVGWMILKQNQIFSGSKCPNHVDTTRQLAQIPRR
jgi:hypothetical protein